MGGDRIEIGIDTCDVCICRVVVGRLNDVKFGEFC